MPIQLKRSLTSGSLPTTASLVQGELALNVPDGRIFLRKSGSGSDTIQSAITTGAQNSGSIALTGSLSIFSATGSVLDVSGDVLSIDGDVIEIAADTMEFTGSFVNSGSLRVVGPSIFSGSISVSGSLNVFNDEFLVQSTGVKIGNVITDAHTLTGSFNISGSVNVFSDEFIVQSTGVKIGNIITDTHNVTGSFSVSGSVTIISDTQINGVFRQTVTTNRQTASYTLVLTDRGKLVEMNVATANNLTVPLNSSVVFPIGTNIDIAQYGAGQTTIVATGSVTVRSAGGALKLAAQYSGGSLIKIGTDEWYLFGDITV